MNVLPVITRELRTQARQPFTYWLRVLGLVAMLGAAGACMLDRGLMPGDGGRLFAFLHATLLFSIWVLVPMSVADCLSQERREGTLGLLLLAPLRPWDIVLAKAAAHAFRAFTLRLVVLPVMALAFLQGGVGWREALLSISINFSSLCAAIGAGALASSYSKQWLRALSLAAIFSGLAGGVVACCKFLTLVLMAMWVLPGRISFPSSDELLIGAWMYVTDARAMWSELFKGGFPGSGGYNWAVTCGEVISSLIVFSLSLGLLRLAARSVRRRWREEPPSARAQQMEKVFCEPVIGVAFLRGWMRRKLAHNPIGWLEQRRWSGRLVTWAWFAIIISVQTAVLTDSNFQWGYVWSQTVMALLLAGSMAASAAGSFRRERETGVLELLLVSPLTTGQIIRGRLRGLWGQFLPSIVTLLGIWIYFASIFRHGDDFPRVWFFLITFAVMPVIGLYFSVRCKSFISAFLFTLAFVFVMPLGFVLLVRFVTWLSSNTNFHFVDGLNDLATSIWFFQLGLAGFFLRRLHHKLATRSFPLERAGS